jgi:hypothetical protein
LNFLQHITPRFTEPELEQALEPVRYRILDLESEMSAQSRQFLPGQRGASAQLRTDSGTRDISAPVGAQPMTCCYRLYDQET